MKIKKILTYVIPILLIIIGICIIAFPWIYKYKNEKTTKTMVQDFLAFVEEENVEEEIETLEENSNTNSSQISSDLYGIITIPSINLQAPIKEGITKNILDSSAGIYFTSNIPIGNLGGNVGIAAHSGRNKGACWYCYFDYIGQLNIGDDIYLTLHSGEELHYQVIEVATYQDPSSDYAYRTDDNEARITLVTCSDGNGKYRTFVTAKRIF